MDCMVMHKAQHLLDSVSHMRMCDGTPHLLGKTASLDGVAQDCEGSTVALFLGNDGRVLELQQQQFVDHEKSSQHNLSCRRLRHEFIRAGRRQMFPLHAYSFHYELKVVAPCLIIHHSLSQKPLPCAW